jgi:uncharacterized protein (TIGR02231 family)
MNQTKPCPIKGRVFFYKPSMKKFNLLLTAVILSFTSSMAQETSQDVTAPVQSAIIYLYGAEIFQTKSVQLNAGRNRIVFKGLSSKLNSKSIQVNATGDVSILAISDQINYIDAQQESPRAKQLRDSVTLFTDAVAQLNNDKDAYTLEKEMLLKNQSIGGTDKGLTAAELKLAADLFRARIKEINAESYKLDKKIEALTVSLTKSSSQLQMLSSGNNRPTAEISILIHSALKQTSTINLKYIVADAGWAPSYDLSAEDINQPVELQYRAKVFNNTGVDWTDIRIKLSTADPSQSAAKPQMSPWTLDFTNNVVYKKKAYSQAYGNAPAQEQSYGSYELLNSVQTQPQIKHPAKAIEFEEIEVSELSAEFDIKIAYSIPADSKPYIVDVTEYKLPAKYQHYSVPKIDHDAFLLARITGWEDLDLVEGPANVYYAGTYVGQSYIYTRSADDTLDLSLGRDNKVLVTRSKIKDFNSKKLLGNMTKETFAYEIVVKNNRKTPVTIDIEDQLPQSAQSDITVEAIETTKAEHDMKTGKLTWQLTMQPGDVKKITLSYSIKYPKNSVINTQQTKTKMRAKL